YKFSHSARNATRVIAISECTKRDLVALYDLEPAKIDVVYQG
ncbi:MAG: glycosyltransferase, partial [Paramuribaculum sp.]|nr:glycosyltransferase [Paramuribaculum sp.]